MATKIVEGCVISVPATYFDGRGAEKWSQQEFGDRWNTATCSGIVLRILRGGQWCRVKWDVDGAVTRVAVRDLHVDKWPHVSSSTETDVSEEEEGPEIVGIEHQGSRQGQTSLQDDSPISSDSENSSSIEESSSSESVSSDEEVNDPTNGCGRKVRLCCTSVTAVFVVSL